jgi:uncharacterized protein YjdB
MNKRITNSFLLCICLLVLTTTLKAQSNIKYGDDYIVIEAEDTGNTIDKWVVRTPSDPKYLSEYDASIATPGSPDPINSTYLEYTGAFANEDQGILTYTFTAPKTGTYQLGMRMHCPIPADENRGDIKNDMFIKMEGNFTSGSAKWSTNQLKELHKFFGRGRRIWGTANKLEIGGGHDFVFYDLTQGETYTFTMNGRSSGTSIDYIVFFNPDDLLEDFLRNKDLAVQLPVEMRPNQAAETVQSVSLDKTNVQLDNIGDTSQLTATIFPETATEKSVSWNSDNTSVATVNATGLVTAIGNGNATITVTTTDNARTATCNVHVGLVVNQIITWISSPLSAATDVLSEGILVESINFSGGAIESDYDTTINGVLFSGATNGADDNNAWGTPSTNNFSATSTGVTSSTDDNYDTGAIGVLADFDVLLSGHLFDASEQSITISNLVVGKKYKIQFFSADTRTTQNDAYIAIDGAGTFGSNSTTIYGANSGLSIIGTFTAAATSFSFNYAKIKGSSPKGIHLNGYQLRDTSSLSVNDVTLADFNLYPNPAKDSFNVNLKNSEAIGSKINITNLNGQVIYKDILDSKTKNIDTSNLNPGLYLIHISSDQASLTKKLIIK